VITARRAIIRGLVKFEVGYAGIRAIRTAGAQSDDGEAVKRRKQASNGALKYLAGA
jgi:hypothetical protein